MHVCVYRSHMHTHVHLYVFQSSNILYSEGKSTSNLSNIQEGLGFILSYKNINKLIFRKYLSRIKLQVTNRTS